MPVPENTNQGDGRPPHFVRFPDMEDDIVNTIADCGTYEMAAAKAGIAEGTLYAYLRKARRARAHKEQHGEDAELTPWDDEYIRLLERIEKEEEEVQEELVSQIRQDPSWTSNAWILERRFGWTKDQTVKHTGPDGGAVRVTMDFGDTAKEIAERRIEEEQDNLKDGDQKVIDGDYEVVEDGEEDA